MRVSTRTEISKLHTRLSATMIYVTHDQVEAMTMGDRICVMKDGRIMQVAEPLTLYNRPENMFVAGFIGSPSMNFFPGTIRSHGTGLDFLETNSGASPLIVSLDERLARQVSSRVGRAVILGLRPEDISEAVRSPSGPGCEVKVELVEPMGAETYLHLTTGATNFIARVKPLNRYTQGQFVSVFLDLTKAHCFDPATQNVIK
jgi:multiple sugar transport system ATP-binding protein